VVRPILQGTLYALKHEVIREAGGYEQFKLFMLPRLYRTGDGDCGICFEWAVHDAITKLLKERRQMVEDGGEGPQPPIAVVTLRCWGSAARSRTHGG